MELIHSDIPRGKIRCAIFDFDGTLSLLREGWQKIMAALMLDRLQQTPTHENAAARRAFAFDLIDQTTGQQTIYQMIRLAEEVEKRGGKPDTPQMYLNRFTERMLARVRARVAAIEAGADAREAWLVPGALPLLRALRARGVTCYIASGTDEKFVHAEATALGLAPFFAGIFGAHADYKNHSKKVVIGNLVAQHGLSAGELVAFGDGSTEIADTKAIGGIAVGVATNEDTRAGVNPRKRKLLLQAGADIIIPDFREHAALLTFLFAES